MHELVKYVAKLGLMLCIEVYVEVIDPVPREHGTARRILVILIKRCDLINIINYNVDGGNNIC